MTRVLPVHGWSLDEVVLEAQRSWANASPKLVLLFASPPHPLASLLARFREAFPHTSVLGASTAGEFTEAKETFGAIAAVAIEGDYRISVGFASGLSREPTRCAAEAVGQLTRVVDGYPHATAVLLIDALAGAGEEAALSVATELGPNVALAGGAAGDGLAMKHASVGCDERVGEDAIAIALIHSKHPLTIAAAHGHAALSTSGLRVTRAENNVVVEIDGRPAWEVWKEQTSRVAAEIGIDVEQLTGEAQNAFLLRFQAGLSTGAPSANGEDLKVRAPLSMREDGALIFATAIPEGSVIRVMRSDAKAQVESAKRAAEKARAGTVGPLAGAVVFDCICRKLILGDAFGEATSAISNRLGSVPIAGFGTYGEIALNAGEMSGFHNTTTVVLAFPRDE